MSLMQVLVVASMASGPSIPSVATVDRLWLVDMSPKDAATGADLGVLGTSAPADTMIVLRRMRAAPVQLAALDASLWVLSRRTNRDDLVDVLRLTAVWNASDEGWRTRPQQGFEVLPSMTCQGEAQLVVTDGGPWLACTDTSLTLYRLEGGRWVDVALASQPPMRRTVLLAGGARPVLLGQAEDGSLHVTRPVGDSAWDTTTCQPTARVDGAVAADGRIILAHHAGQTLQCSTLAGGVVRPLTDVTVQGGWGMSLAGETLTVVDRGGPGGRLRRVQIDVTNPASQLTAPIDVTIGRATGIWSMVLSVGIAVAVISMLLVTRTASPLALPSTKDSDQQGPPVGVLRRLVAVAIDGLAPAAVVVVALDVTPQHLVRLPLLGMQPESLEAALWWALITGVWAAVWTVFWGSTPGLRVVGGRIVDALGGRPTRGAAVRRGLLLALVLLAPPLALLVLLSPGRLSLADTISRTRVVRRGN